MSLVSEVGFAPRRSSFMRGLRAALLVLHACAAWSCRTAPPEHAHALANGQVVVHKTVDTTVATLVHGGSGIARVSLYLDAGSRDASPPQVATIAAWLAAGRSRQHLEALVTPDASEFARNCDSRQLETCFAELRRVLDTRAATDAELTRLRVQLREGRRRALAKDPEALADRAALQALLGESAAGFFPLGEAAEDQRVDAAHVSAFLRAHYGPRRALVVVAGDADPEHVREAAARALAGAAQAEQPRASRRLSIQPSPRVATVLDERDSVTLALAAADATTAHRFAAALADAVRQDGAGIALRGDVFTVRGGALALLRAPARNAEATLRTLARQTATLLVEPPPEAAPPQVADDLASISRAFAERWNAAETMGAEPTLAAQAPLAFAAGVLVQGGRGDGVREKNQALADPARAQQRMQHALAEALASVHPVVRGTVTAHAASVVTSNGARIEVRAQRAGHVAIAIRSALGAGEDPPLLHGRTALLATLTATACAGMGPERLRGELDRLGATLAPRVDAQSYGVVLTLPRNHATRGIDLAIRCLREPSEDPLHFADAALRLQARLGGKQSPLGLRALVAQLLSPRAPGLCAPWGHPEVLGNLTASEVHGVLARAATGARASVAVVGELPVASTVAAVARRIALLPRGSLPSPIEPGSGASPPLAASTTGTDVRMLAVWQAERTHDELADAVAARVAAGALATVLSRTAGFSVLSRDGDACADKTWVALELSVAPSALAEVAPTLARAALTLDRTLLTEAVEQAQSAERARAADAGSRLDRAADELARARLADRAAGTGPRGDALFATTALLHATALVVPLD